MKRTILTWLLLSLVIISFLAPLVVLAQDEVVTPEEGANQLLTLIVTIVNVPFAAVVILFAADVIVRVQNRLFGLTYVGANLLFVVLSAVVWASYAIANQAGVGQQYLSAFEFITALVKTAGPYLLGLLGTVATATAVRRYNATRNLSVMTVPDSPRG